MKKKICAAIVCAFAMMFGALSVSPMTASALGYRDLTGDGKISAGDSQLIVLYTLGVCDYARGPLTDMDADGNYIIERLDSNLYLLYYLENLVGN